MTDAQLVREALQGGNGAYEQLVRRWSPRVMAVCHARLGRADCVDDLTQESLLRALRSLASLSEPEKFGPWVCGIATRVCLDWLKSRHRGDVEFSALSDQQPNWPAREGGTDVDRLDEIDRLMSEVERLPLPHREVLMLYYYDDLTYAQLGEVLNVSAATINARLTQARQMLRQRLGATQGDKREL